MTTTLAHIKYDYTPLADGRTVILFVNKQTNLIVVDIIDADQSGGIEITRYTA